MLRQAGLLLGLELVAHVVDYGFHIYLGRSLPPAEFAVFQSYFTLAMLLITLGGILQPPVTRYVSAPPETPGGPASAGAVARTYLWQGAAAGLLAGGALYLATPLLAEAAHLPLEMLHLVAMAMPLAMMRPVLLGLLQGKGRFGSLGSITLFYALVRLALALWGLGFRPEPPVGSPWGTYWAALTLPLAILLAVLLGLVLSRRELAEPGRLPWHVARRGWGLSLANLLMACAFLVLTGLDMIWVNRSLPGEVAGAYGRAVVLRRVVSFIPLAMGTVLLPRVAARRRDDRAIALAVGLVLVSGTALTILYGLLGGALDRIAFGAQMVVPTPWLAGMAWAMTGYGLVTVWLNVFMATEPLPYSYLLVAGALIQLGLYVWLGHTPEVLIVILAASGWLLALVGAALYLFWLRPRTARQGSELGIE